MTLRVLAGWSMRITLALALASPVACVSGDGADGELDEAEPVDVEAILWCVAIHAAGETSDGEQVFVLYSKENRGACMCLPVGTQPTSGSELDRLIHEMALEQCEDELQQQGAVSTNCAEQTRARGAEYETTCDPDDWPPPPI